MGASKARCAGVDCIRYMKVNIIVRKLIKDKRTCTTSLLTADIPCAGNGSTILTLSEGRAATTGLKFPSDVETLIVPCGHAHNGAGI